MYHSPLRYPGGKRKLANFFKLIFRANDLLDGEYAEPYAGGAAVALALLFGEYARRIYINDIDRGVYAFWDAVLNQTDTLCQRITDVHVNMEEWERQRAVQEAENPDPIDLAFSTFFLNRTNRSGIITGGVIGGKAQSGEWKLDARFNKEDLVERIEKIGRYSSRIELFNLDAAKFIDHVTPRLSTKSLIYLDPPYYVKGNSLLYANFYDEQDHAFIARKVAGLKNHWVVSYDNVEEIRKLYTPFREVVYGISYSTQSRYQGKEVIFFSKGLSIPEVDNPSSIRSRVRRKIESEMLA